MKKNDEKFTIMRSRFLQNFEFAYFTLFNFALDGKEMYQNVPRAYKVIVLAH